MDGELVSGSLSATTEGEPIGSPSFTYTEKFYADFPYYLSIGMTYDQYWNDDVDLVKHYRKADLIRTERMNYEKWLQGMYIYEAICDASPILQAFAKRGTKPIPYPDKPYSITETEHKRAEESHDKKVFDKGKAMMEIFMEATNKKFKDKENIGGECDVG